MEAEMNLRKKTSSNLLRIISVTIICFMLVTSLAIPAAASSSGQLEHKSTKRVIAIVFDNSGSMFGTNNAAWCRALYAIEVFAAMLNDGDELYVHPMNPISIGSAVYTSKDPLLVTKDEADIIEDIVSESGKTPIEAVEDAYSNLKRQTADEKWLIVLTDGDEYYKDGVGVGSGENSSNLMTEELKKCTGCEKMFLGIGKPGSDKPVAEPDPSSGCKLIETVNSSAEVLTTLTNMCNAIFGRHELTQSGNSIDFDISMSKIICFVQGANISDVTISPMNASSFDSKPIRYNEHGRGGTGADKDKCDTELQGVIVTFENLDVGSYSLAYNGTAKSISIYYEPDVDIVARLVDANGNPVSESEGLYPGTYYLEYGIVDRNHPEVFATSNLLGTNIEYNVTYSIDDVTQTVNTAGPIEIQLGEDQTLTTDIEVNFLGEYTLRRSGKDLGWPFTGTIHVNPFPIGSLNLGISGPTSINLSEFTSALKYNLSLKYDGINVDFTDVSVTAQIDGTALECSYDNGVVTIPAPKLNASICGDYTISVSAEYVNEHGKTVSAQASTRLRIEDDISGLPAVLSLNGPDCIMLSEMKDNVEYSLEFLYDSKPVDASRLNVTANIDGEGMRCRIENGKLILNASKLDASICGEHVIDVSASYINDYDEKVIAKTSRTIIIEDDTSTLEVKLSTKQLDNYYVKKDIDNSEPLILTVSLNGQALTDEQMKALDVKIDSAGLDYESCIIPGGSAIEIRIRNTEAAKNGWYNIICSVTTLNEVGNPISADANCRIKIAPFSIIFIWLFILAIIALLAVLFVLYMNQNVLPDKVYIPSGGSRLSIANATFIDCAKCSKIDKRSRTLQLSTTSHDPYGEIGCTVTFNIKPVSPRKIKSARRQILVTGVRVSNPPGNPPVNISASTLVFDKDRSKYFSDTGGEINVKISNHSICEISTRANDFSNQKRNVSFSAQFEFK